MGSYRLSNEAEKDLIRIHQHGVREFGEIQADNYYAAFFDRFEQLAEQPYMYPSANEVRAGYRQSVCGVDTIYYRVVDGVVEIMSILGRQDREEWL